jgi:hypothetical protein
MSNGIIWKNENYYDEVIPRQDFGTFKANFRLSRQTFVLVLNLMGNSNHFAKRNEAYGGRNQISSEKSLLITLWTLATPESYRAIGDRFNVSKSTVYNSLSPSPSPSFFWNYVQGLLDGLMKMKRLKLQTTFQDMVFQISLVLLMVPISL